MSRSSDPPNDTGNMSYDVTSSKIEDIKCGHMMKLESAAESIGKDYGKYVEIEGTTVSAIYDIMAILQYMAKTEGKTMKSVTAKQIRMMNNMVEMLQA